MSSPEAVSILSSTPSDDGPLRRGHAASALGRIASRADCAAEAIAAIDAGLSSRLKRENARVHEA